MQVICSCGKYIDDITDMDKNIKSFNCSHCNKIIYLIEGVKLEEESEEKISQNGIIRRLEEFFIRFFSLKERQHQDDKEN